MIICLKGISEEIFLFNINANIKFPRALGGLSDSTWPLREHSKSTGVLGFLRHYENEALRTLT